LNSQLRVFNAENCNYLVTTNIDELPNFIVGANDYFEYKNIKTADNGVFIFQYKIEAADGQSSEKNFFKKKEMKIF